MHARRYKHVTFGHKGIQAARHICNIRPSKFNVLDSMDSSTIQNIYLLDCIDISTLQNINELDSIESSTFQNMN